MNAMTRPPVAVAFASALDHPIYQVAVARTLDDLMQVAAVRTLVYMGEQACPYREEYDGNDFAGATHLLVRCDGEPVGVLRIRWFADFAKLERVAILTGHRGRRAAFLLIGEAVRIAERKGYRRILGHAEPRLAPFWTRHFKGKVRFERCRFGFSDRQYMEVVAEIGPASDALTLESDPLILLRPEGDWDRPGVLDASMRHTSPSVHRGEPECQTLGVHGQA